MPRIFDNRSLNLADGLREEIVRATHVDFCVGYFNLRGWFRIANEIDNLEGRVFEDEEGEVETRICRLLIGMQKPPQELAREGYSRRRPPRMDQISAEKWRRKTAEEFREQLMMGIPDDEQEAHLRKLQVQLKAGKVRVKLFLCHPLHAKLYLAYRRDSALPIVGFLGSSNLTFAGLAGQGELNIDVTEIDAAQKLANWFQDQWDNQWCLDITADLIQVLDESWIAHHTPYQIYLKILYHLSKEARGGITEFKIPNLFKGKLLAFQEEAVQRAAKQLNTRKGVIIGDVVGLGKTITAAALAKVFEKNHRLLIICPKNLVQMWEHYNYEYKLGAEILPLSKVTRELPNLRPYNLIIIDESHNLRNRESQRYRAIYNYAEVLNAKFILLSATPYNKSMLDLSSQLRFFISPDDDLGISPDAYIEQLGGRARFAKHHQCSITSLAAFEESSHLEDWRQLMRLYLVRRSRSFVKDRYAEKDPSNGRKYLTFSDGTRSYFPDRRACKVEYPMPEGDPYARLYADDVVAIINSLDLPRYGLGLKHYLKPLPDPAPSGEEAAIIANLAKAGRRLKGFARTNLFKRLESSGHAFLLSLARHIVRNCLFTYAIEQNLPLPIGQQDMGVLDNLLDDEDPEGEVSFRGDNEMSYFREQAKRYYHELEAHHYDKYDWVSSHLFAPVLKTELDADALRLLQILNKVPEWRPAEDRKLQALCDMARGKHAQDKILVFTQFADTANYLHNHLRHNNIGPLEVVTGQSPDPQAAAVRFSPVSNQESIPWEKQTRVLITTDVLSEGQNLQDGHIIVNYDLPWAIIRIIQRAGRVDRIGQKASEIFCYSFLPENGIEKIINLRSRLKQRLEENDEVVGNPDEIFFEDQQVRKTVEDLYAQRDGMLDEQEGDTDLASYAYKLWQEAEKAHPELARAVVEMPNVVYSTKALPRGQREPGTVVYLQKGPGLDMLALLDEAGQVVTTNPDPILRAAACGPDEPTLPRQPGHHDRVAQASDYMMDTLATAGGQLGPQSGVRFKLFHKLKGFYEASRNSLFPYQELARSLDQIYAYPLREYAIDTIGRQLKSGIRDEELARLVITLHEEEQLCTVYDDSLHQEPTVICSLGLAQA